jgi:tRNA(Arg) A34 adenosine deaminase TadA
VSLRGLHIDGPGWLADVRPPPPGGAATDEVRMDWLVGVLERQVDEGTGGPFAAAVFDGTTGAVLAVAVNRVEHSSACIAHAEALALAEAGQVAGSYNLDGRDAVLLSTTEPCAMCLGAVGWSGVVRVVCGAGEADARAIGFDEGDKPPDWPAVLRARGIAVVQGLRREPIVTAMRRYVEAGGTVYNGEPDPPTAAGS